ncbi:MAG TPA: hypothetical protein VMV92_33775 [Streptosporangiaceae bacterium]|nr:hypothetical protein [Streptosporangiaceae bacterium]
MPYGNGTTTGASGSTHQTRQEAAVYYRARTEALASLGTLIGYPSVDVDGGLGRAQ